MLRSESVSHHWREVATLEFAWKARNWKLSSVDLTVPDFRQCATVGLEESHPSTREAMSSRISILSQNGHAGMRLVGILSWACACGHHALLSKLLRYFIIHLHFSLPLMFFLNRENESIVKDLKGGALLHCSVTGKSAACVEVLHRKEPMRAWSSMAIINCQSELLRSEAFSILSR